MNDKNHVQQIIGNNLRTYRQEMKMTQEELAEKAGLSTPFLANLERGTKGMSIFSLRELSSALGISTDCLLFEDNANGHIKNIEMLLRDEAGAYHCCRRKTGTPAGREHGAFWEHRKRELTICWEKGEPWDWIAARMNLFPSYTERCIIS